MTCAICMSALGLNEAQAVCPECAAPYHSECWEENGGCGVYGCRLVPKTEKLTPLEIAPAFWGREEKDCPRCGKQIKAMAVRCRYCGAEVEAKIEEKVAYERRLKQKSRLPLLKKASILLLVMSLLPFVALLSAVFGFWFYRSNREEISKLPGSYDGYYRISIAVGTAQSVIFVLAWAAWWIKVVVLSR